MRLLVRTGSSPVPTQVEVASDGTLADLEGLISKLEFAGAPGRRHKLISRGQVLRSTEGSSRLSDLGFRDGDVLVVLPGRPLARPPPPATPSRGPSLREINAALREEQERRGGPSVTQASEAAEGRAEPEPAAGGAAQQMRPENLSLLMSYVESMRQALRERGQDAGGEAPVTADALAEMMQAFMGVDLRQLLPYLPGPEAAAAAEAALAAAHAARLDEGGSEEEEGLTDEEEDEEDDEGQYTDDEEEGEDGEEEYSDEEDEGEEEEDGDGQAALPPPQVPEPDGRLLADLMDMGFDQQLCRNALLMGRNRFEPALEWLLAHAEDPHAAEPLSDAQLARLYGRGPARQQGVRVNPEALAHLMDMGFDREQAEEALRVCHNSVLVAATWLLSAGPAAGAGQGQAAAAAGEAAAAAAGPSAQQQQHQEAEVPPAGASSSGGSGGTGDAGEGRQAQQQQQQQQAQDAELPELLSDASSGGGSSSEDEDSIPAAPQQQAGSGPPSLEVSDEEEPGSGGDEARRPAAG